MKAETHMLPTLAMIIGALTMGVATSVSIAEGDDVEIQFEETEIFFELNDTDGDLGIHSLIDGDPWKKLIMEDPNDRKMLNVRLVGHLRRQGLTEFFFESAEPPFDELAPQTFFARFPAGEYNVEGRTLDGLEIEGETILTHTMPAPAEPTVNGTPMVEVCDDEDPDFIELVPVTSPVTIAWPEVTMSHPDANGAGAGVQPPIPVTIHNYEVVVEAELETGDGEEFVSVFSVILPPGVNSMTIPDELIDLSDEFKYEVLAREESFNQTAVESCFAVD